MKLILNKNSDKAFTDTQWEFRLSRSVYSKNKLVDANLQLLGQGRSKKELLRLLRNGVVQINYLSLTRSKNSQTGSVSLQIYLVGSAQNIRFHLVGSVFQTPLVAADVQTKPTG